MQRKYWEKRDIVYKSEDFFGYATWVSLLCCKNATLFTKTENYQQKQFKSFVNH